MSPQGQGGGHKVHNDKVRRAPRWTGQIQADRQGVVGG
jgi:hypothetical protein